MAVKAIETYYKGYRFRSRLEARWAVYFDAIGLKWEYEKEGFTLSNGIKYLPDFWLPEAKVWAEVKASAFEKDELLKACLLEEGEGHRCLLLDGAPDVRPYLGTDDIHRVLLDWYASYLRDREDILDKMSDQKERGITMNGYVLSFDSLRYYGYFFATPTAEEVEDFEDIEYAVIASRSARFEFGENGNATN